MKTLARLEVLFEFFASQQKDATVWRQQWAHCLLYLPSKTVLLLFD